LKKRKSRKIATFLYMVQVGNKKIKKCQITNSTIGIPFQGKVVKLKNKHGKTFLNGLPIRR